MMVAGVDVGSRTASALILQDNEIICWSIIDTGSDSVKAGVRALEIALQDKGLSVDDIRFIVSTGYGRLVMPLARKNITEITCHARGAQWLCPGAKTILDMGGQDCKVMKCNEAGKVLDFKLNDKCAAGAGRYLEKVAVTLKVPLDELGTLSLDIVERPLDISSYCAVFAQSDILLLLRMGKPINDILAGACDALSKRILGMIREIGLNGKFFISGGIAKNIGIVTRLEDNLGVKAFVPYEPQVVGALGAALFAKDLGIRSSSS